MFPDLTQNVEKSLSKILGSVSHHLHPDIVKYIIESNIGFKEKFQQYSHKELNIHEFFFEGSDSHGPRMVYSSLSDVVSFTRLTLVAKEIFETSTSFSSKI